MPFSLARVYLLISALLLCSVPLSGQEPCDTARTQTDMNTCAQQVAARSNARLRSLLADLRARLDSSRFGQLSRVQAQWQAYRKAHCDWEGDGFAGGSVAPAVVSNCFAAVTEARIAEGMTGECTASHRYDRPQRSKRDK
jgi:uncharacterized protein YecT (DUF1311 family)